MLSRRAINLLIILGFLVLVGFSLAMSISRKNVLGIVLALISLGSAVAFIYYLGKSAELRENEQAEDQQGY